MTPSMREAERQGRTLVVAEIAQAHDGSLGILLSMVEAAAACGVDAVKFQVHIAHAESGPEEPFRVPFSPVDRTRFDYWKRMELPEQAWRAVRDRCVALGVEFMATPFSCAAVDLLHGLGVRRMKIGSGDAANPLLLRRAAAACPEVILSTGLATDQELDASVSLLRGLGVEVGLLHCTTRYPTPAEAVGLQGIDALRRRHGCPAGLSDHSGSVFAGLGAAALGAAMVEVHVTFDRRMFGPDAAASLDFGDLRTLVEGVRWVRTASVARDQEATPGLESLRSTFGRSLSVCRDMRAGETIRLEDLECRKPAGVGLPVTDLDRVLGKTLRRPKTAWSPLLQEDLG